MTDEEVIDFAIKIASPVDLLYYFGIDFSAALTRITKESNSHSVVFWDYEEE